MTAGSNGAKPKKEIQMTHKIILNGEKFQLEEVVAIARHGVGVSVESEARIQKARQLVDQWVNIVDPNVKTVFCSI